MSNVVGDVNASTLVRLDSGLFVVVGVRFDRRLMLWQTVWYLYVFWASMMACH